MDNILSHHHIPGVLQGRQGITRRVTPQALLHLEIIAVLSTMLKIPVAHALDLASRLIKQDGKEINFADSPHVRISADVKAIAAELNTRLEHALEISPTPRRGRPAHI